MLDRHYDPKLSVGVILAGACLAPIIPPSLVAVIIGSLADVSIASLLLAGIVPGLIISALTLVYVFVRMPSEALDAQTTSTSDMSTGAALLRLLPFTLVIFSVMGLILLGIATPSEAAGTGVVGALGVAAIYGKLSLAMMRDALLLATRVSGAILLIVASSVLLGQLLALGGASSGIIRWVAELDIGQTALLIAMMLIPLILCMFIDQIAFMLAAIPLYQPILQTMDVDPVWFWTLFAVNLTIGTITPPFGYTLFALTASGPRAPSVGLAFRASWPIVAVLLVALATFFAVPQIILAPLGR
jgi:tripartite ATP-independent transporter DctM subunit